jgi:sulfite reductase (NADPH) hemoprotein beta-component
MNKLYAEDLQHDDIVATLDPLLAAYAKERQADERFGAFLIRAGYVAQTNNGRDFHADTGPQRAV